eukprot:scaffold579136_cov17-Prasinocladus_malaysianus.AAC.1
MDARLSTNHQFLVHDGINLSSVQLRGDSEHCTDCQYVQGPKCSGRSDTFASSASLEEICFLDSWKRLKSSSIPLWPTSGSHIALIFPCCFI